MRYCYSKVYNTVLVTVACTFAIVYSVTPLMHCDRVFLDSPFTQVTLPALSTLGPHQHLMLMIDDDPRWNYQGPVERNALQLELVYMYEACLKQKRMSATRVRVRMGVSILTP